MALVTLFEVRLRSSPHSAARLKRLSDRASETSVSFSFDSVLLPSQITRVLGLTQPGDPWTWASAFLVFWSIQGRPSMTHYTVGHQLSPTECFRVADAC